MLDGLLQVDHKGRYGTFWITIQSLSFPHFHNLTRKIERTRVYRYFWILDNSRSGMEGNTLRDFSHFYVCQHEKGWCSHFYGMSKEFCRCTWCFTIRWIISSTCWGRNREWTMARWTFMGERVRACNGRNFSVSIKQWRWIWSAICALGPNISCIQVCGRENLFRWGPLSAYLRPPYQFWS